jgi:mono/diheme cytochrome c family protein
VTAVIRGVLTLALVTGCAAPAVAAEADVTRGRTLVTRMCAECHAIGRTGESPHTAAPAFRNLDRRLDLDQLVERMRDGLMTGHDMPMFRFTRDEARAVVSYLRSIQVP